MGLFAKHIALNTHDWRRGSSWMAMRYNLLVHVADPKF